MSWQNLLGLSLIAVSLLVGCRNSQSELAKVEPDLNALMPQQSATSLQARGQKAEQTVASRPGSVLDIPPGTGGSDQRVVLIVAVVGGEAILDEEVQEAAKGALLGVRTEEEKAKVLKQKLTELIDREVVLQDAFAKLSGKGSRFLDILKKEAGKAFNTGWVYKHMKAQNLADEAEFKQWLRANNGPSYELVRRQFERNFIATEYLRYRIEPHVQKIGHLQVAEYYEKNQEQFKVEDEVEWQDIFVSSISHANNREAARQFAEVLATRIRKGENFVALSKEFDNGTARFGEKSEGIGRKAEDIRPPEAAVPLFAMQEGEVRLIELETGYHIVRLVKRQRAGIRPFDESVQAEIKNKLRGEVFQRESKRIVQDLKQRTIIEIARDTH